MPSKILSRYNYFIVFFVFSASIQTFGQSNFHLFGMGGVNYIPMKNYSHFINQFTNPKIDEVGFNGCFGVKYSQSDNHMIFISSEIINKNASYSGGFSMAVWNFRVIPISLGYQYVFSNKENVLKPYVGFSVSYSFIEIRGFYSDDMPPSYNELRKRNKFSIEPIFGFTYTVVDRLSLITEIKYRYISDIEYWYQNVNLSGLLLNIGIQVNVL